MITLRSAAFRYEEMEMLFDAVFPESSFTAVIDHHDRTTGPPQGVGLGRGV